MPATRINTSKPAKSTKSKGAAKASSGMTFADVMKALEKAGSAQTKKTYARHGASEPMFGVSFATLGDLRKKIRVDHDLALRLWDTGNFDARNLAFKIADPLRMSAADLDRWARDTCVRMCSLYPPMLAAEGLEGFATARRWLASSDERLRCAGWGLVQQLAARDPAVPDSWLAERLAEIERTIHAVPNERRGAMNAALISIGGRSAALRKAALAAAKRIGKVEVDHGDTACKTPDAAPYIEKMWERARAGGFDTPSAHEQSRESGRIRC